MLGESIMNYRMADMRQDVRLAIEMAEIIEAEVLSEDDITMITSDVLSAYDWTQSTYDQICNKVNDYLDRPTDHHSYRIIYTVDPYSDGDSQTKEAVFGNIQTLRDLGRYWANYCSRKGLERSSKIYCEPCSETAEAITAIELTKERLAKMLFEYVVSDYNETHDSEYVLTKLQKAGAFDNDISELNLEWLLDAVESN